MATSQTTNASAKHQSPKLATALLKLQYMKIADLQFRGNIGNYENYKAKAKAMLANFTEPFLCALRDSDSYLIGEGNELAHFSRNGLVEGIQRDSYLAEELNNYHKYLPLLENRSDEQESDLRDGIAMFISYGFAAGMMFSGRTGATMDSESEEVVNG